MKILHTIAGMDTRSGGPSTCTYELVKALNRIDCPTDILTLAPTAGGQMIGSDDFVHTVPNDAKTPFVYSKNFRNALYQHADYQLIHTNGLWLYPNYLSARFARKKKIPYLISPHGMLYPQSLAVKPWRKKIIRALGFDSLLGHADCIHATCEQEMEHYRNLGFRNPVAVIPNCIAIPDYIAAVRPDRSRRRIGFLGRLHPIKNIELMIAAWQKLGDTVKDAEFLIIGDGEPEYVANLQALAASCRGKVRFIPFVADREKFELLASLSALLLMSKTENFGMTVLESLMVGTPVIAGKKNPWAALAQHQCGFWIDNDVDILAQTIRRCLDLNVTQFDRMSQLGVHLVEDNYSALKIAGNMKKVYDWLGKTALLPEEIVTV